MHQNPFRKHKKPEIKTHEPSVNKEGEPTMLLTINSLYQIENTTISPDQLLSITTMLMNYSAKVLSTYTEKFPEEMGSEAPVKYQEVMDKMVQATHIYTLIDAGMTTEEASKIVGLRTESHEIPNKNS